MSQDSGQWLFLLILYITKVFYIHGKYMIASSGTGLSTHLSLNLQILYLVLLLCHVIKLPDRKKRTDEWDGFSIAGTERVTSKRTGMRDLA